MKKLNALSLFTLLFTALFLYSCDNTQDEITPTNSVLPETFSIAIPEALSNESALADNGSTDGRLAGDGLNGNHIYRHLNLFIHVGDKSARMVQEIMSSIRKHNINRSMSLSFQSEEDGRVKNLRVIESSAFEGQSWQYELLITDADSEGEADGGKALQVFWNTSPVEGIAILKPANINRTDQSSGAIFRIDYSEAGSQGYDAHMIVQIDRLPVSGRFQSRFSMNSLKMFVGKKGEVVDVYGNSDHPYAKFFTEKSGYSWAFVASGNEKENYGVAEVGLPFRTVNSSSRAVLLEEYAIKDVFTREIQEAHPQATQEQIDYFLQNTEAPGFFAQGGFVQGGTSPDSKYDELLERIGQLAPYNPKNIADLEISFK